jgi:hypothetical protein
LAYLKPIQVRVRLSLGPYGRLIDQEICRSGFTPDLDAAERAPHNEDKIAETEMMRSESEDGF